MTDTRLTLFADNVWTDTAPVKILGMPLSASMTVLRLSDGSLLLYSPLAMTLQRRAAIDTLGPVAHLYAPNLYHHLRIGEWSAAYPEARVHAPLGLAAKRPDLRIDRYHGQTPEPAFADLIDEVPLAGFRLNESVLVYRPARTLIVADLVHNIGRPPELWTRIYTQAMGFYDRVALSRMIRLAGISDAKAFRASLEKLLALPFEQMIVGHGSPVKSAAKAALADAFRLPYAPNTPRKESP